MILSYERDLFGFKTIVELHIQKALVTRNLALMEWYESIFQTRKCCLFPINDVERLRLSRKRSHLAINCRFDVCNTSRLKSHYLW